MCGTWITVFFVYLPRYLGSSAAFQTQSSICQMLLGAFSIPSTLFVREWKSLILSQHNKFTTSIQQKKNKRVPFVFSAPLDGTSHGVHIYILGLRSNLFCSV